MVDKVEKAEKTLGKVVEGGKAIEIPKAKPPDLNASSKKALKELGYLAGQVGRNDAFLKQLNTLGPMIMDAGKPREYGFEKPEKIFRNEKEAKIAIKREDDWNKSRIALKKARAERKGFFASLWDNTKTAAKAVQNALSKVRNTIDDFFTKTINPFYRSSAGLNREIATQWLNESYLGTINGKRFAATPPMLTVELDKGFFERVANVYGCPAVGLQFEGTNLITIAKSLENKPEADRRKTITHEQLHYASELGGGKVIRWKNQKGDLIVYGYAKWLHEGLTELHAQQITRSKGYTPSRVSYALETITGVYLQRLVGAGVLKEAYLTGDFSKVREIVDKKLGTDSFDGMMKTNKGVDALLFLRNGLNSAGINYSSWDKDPVAAMAWKDIGGR